MKANYFRRTLSLTLLLLALHVTLSAQRLKIYHIGVGQGDCTLIIASDSTTNGNYSTLSVLIDAGPVRSAEKVEVLWDFIKDRLEADGADGIDYFVISHLHSDHMYGAPGLLETIRKEDPDWINSMMIVDRIGLYSDWGINSDECWDYESTNIIKKYNDEVSKYFASNRIPVPFGKNLFSVAGFRNMGMLCVASNGVVDGKSYVKPKFLGAKLPKSENDLSFAFLLQFQGFRYFTGGDVGGGSPYSDIETPIVDYFKKWNIKGFHFCCFKVSHHGSTHSTNDAFLKFTNPSFGIIPAALRPFNGSKLPSKATIDALEKIGTKLLYTFVPSGSEYYKGDAKAYSDVIVEVSSPPGYNNNISMKVTTYERNPKTLKITGNLVTQTLTCTQAHNK